ncbi:hypothetical protein ZIOFF_062571 [Zingiber officinale]|uniref:Uncharacterized protein n=1 Tax=Zingiber officinale TaxID=94328 RepID=A0A8J5KAU9_ZINOF|nr:hypothetical protein ZIOFF_062571 [Zingiber officinale]
MASAQIYGPGLGMRSSMKPSLAAIRPSLPLRTMEFRIKCFKVPSVRVINISNRKFYVSMRANRRNSQSDFEASTDTIYPEDKFDKSESIESNPVVQEATAPTQKTARIHDFCLGIPYGGFLFFGGLLGFVLSRNPTGLIFGGVISALSIFSLIVWSSGGSSIPFILGQTVEEVLPCITLPSIKCGNGLLLFLRAALRWKPTAEEVSKSESSLVLVVTFANLY